MKFQEIEDEKFKEHKDDLVFATWRAVNGERGNFEVHFDKDKGRVGAVYLVK